MLSMQQCLQQYTVAPDPNGDASRKPIATISVYGWWLHSALHCHLPGLKFQRFSGSSTLAASRLVNETLIWGYGSTRKLS